MLELSRIQETLERARHDLREVEESLSKVEGKGFKNGPARFSKVKQETKSRFPPLHEGSRLPPNDLSFNLRRNNRTDYRDGSGPGKQRIMDEVRPVGVFARLSDLPRSMAVEDEEDEFSTKPALLSRVIATPVEVPSRQEVIAAQTADEKSKQRNRRMFGALLGTLQKFKREENQVKEREEKRLKVEQKLEEDAKREKERMAREKEKLLVERKMRESEIKRIEWSLNRVKEFSAWEAHVMPTKNYIKTHTEPSIFYMPRVSNAKTEELLAASKKRIERLIERRQNSLREEIENSEKKARRRRSGSGRRGVDVEEEGEVEDDEDDEDVDKSDNEDANMDSVVNKENLYHQLVANKLDIKVELSLVKTGKSNVETEREHADGDEETVTPAAETVSAVSAGKLKREEVEERGQGVDEGEEVTSAAEGDATVAAQQHQDVKSPVETLPPADGEDKTNIEETVPASVAPGTGSGGGVEDGGDKKRTVRKRRSRSGDGRRRRRSRSPVHKRRRTRSRSRSRRRSRRSPLDRRSGRRGAANKRRSGSESPSTATTDNNNKKKASGSTSPVVKKNKSGSE